MASAGLRRSLIVPREHGAWGILLIPMLTGACVALLQGSGSWSLAPLVVVALGLFWLRTPIESWTGAAPMRARTESEMRLVRNTSLVLAVISTGALIALFWRGRHPALFAIGAAAGLAFLIQAVLRRISPAAAQMIGAAGLTSTAPAAYYVMTGQLNLTAWSLWAANLLFAVNQIHFVQLQIHAARAKCKPAVGRDFLIGQILLIVLLAAACALHLFRWSAALAFLPVLYRGFGWFTAGLQPLRIHALGRSELMYACAFGVLLVLGFTFPRS